MNTSGNPRMQLSIIVAALVLLIAGSISPSVYRHYRPVAYRKPVAQQRAKPVHTAARPVEAPQPPSPTPVVPPPAPVASLASLQQCAVGTNDIVVAHQDDDVLFMNPQLAHDIAAGTCVRTIYVTAGDGGHAQAYWQGREEGSEAAYAAMFNAPNVWHDSTAMVGSHTLQVRSLDGHPQVALIFLRLPDGAPRGQGFQTTNYESLDALSRGTLQQIHTVDTQTPYSYQDLVTTIGSIITFDKPQAVYTQLPSGDATDGDHLDHTTVGRITQQAWTQSYQRGVLTSFIGYPMGRMAENLSPDDTALKHRIFGVYESHDTVICRTPDICDGSSTYDNYLSRMYTVDETPR